MKLFRGRTSKLCDSCGGEDFNYHITIYNEKGDMIILATTLCTECRKDLTRKLLASI